jgi:DNA repair protein RecO (recombination protein O)
VVEQSFAARAYRDEAVVLRTHKLGEADRIITLLTKHHGQVRAVAKGVRRTSSRFGARLEPFMVADLQLVSGKSLDIVTQAVARGAYGGNIAADYASYKRQDRTMLSPRLWAAWCAVTAVPPGRRPPPQKQWRCWAPC